MAGDVASQVLLVVFLSQHNDVGVCYPIIGVC